MSTFVSLGDLLPELCVEVDVTTNPGSATRTWTDITPHVRSVDYTRSGRSDELQRTTTGTLTAVCTDQAGAISGLGIHVHHWIRVRARWDSVVYPVWQGIFESLPRTWHEAGSDPVVELRAADVLKVLRMYDLNGETFAAQRNDQRIVALATLAGLSTGSIDTLTDDADAYTVGYAVGTNALGVALDIEGSESGLLIAEADGTISFQGRHYRLLHKGTSAATFGETSGEIPYRDTVQYIDDDTWLGNPVAVTAVGGATYIAEDASLFTKHLPKLMTRQLASSDATLADDAAHYLLAKYKDPEPRIPQLDVQLAAVARHASSDMATLLGAGNSDRFTWNREADAPISADVYLEQVGGTIDREGTWDLALRFSPAADEKAWVLGQDGASELGQTTYLTY